MKKRWEIVVFLWTARSCSEPPVRGLRHEDIAFLRCLVIQKKSRNLLTLVHADSFDSLNFNNVGPKMIAKSTCKAHGMYHERILQTIETWNDVKSLISSPMVDFRCVFVDPTFQSMICSPFPVPTRFEWPEKKENTDDLLPSPGHESIINQLKSRSRLFGCNTRLNLLDDSSHDPGVVDKLVNNRRPESSLGRSLDFSGVGGKPIDMLAQEGLLDFLVNIEHEFQLLLCMSRGFWLHPPSRSLFFHS